MRLRFSLRATLRGALITGFRFATALRLRSLLGGTSFIVNVSFSTRARFMGVPGDNSLLTGMRRGGSKSHASPKMGMERREPVSMLWRCATIT